MIRYDITELSMMFRSMGHDGMLIWCEHYGILPLHLINELKAKPLTFKNWNNLDEADKLFLRNIPDEWIPSVYQFDDFCFIKKFCPVEIPNNAIISPKQKKVYKQVTFEWLDNLGFTIEARVHQPIPGSAYFSNGQVWIINFRIKGPVNGSTRSYNDVYLGNGEFIQYEKASGSWRSLVTKQQNGFILTDEESSILARGHFKAK